MNRIIVLAALAMAPLGGCQARAVHAESGLGVVPLTIRSGKVSHRFNVEVARTAEEQARGLMFREKLGPSEGMIFPMKPPRVAGFWMKNTVIPLDMIFVRADGTIARIEAETIPYSLAQVESGEPVAAVLEIAGGRAGQLGLKENDKVEWAAP